MLVRPCPRTVDLTACAPPGWCPTSAPSSSTRRAGHHLQRHRIVRGWRLPRGQRACPKKFAFLHGGIRKRCNLVWAGGATGRVAGHLIGMWGRGSSAAAGTLARYREGARVRERIREARLAEANRQAGTMPPPRRGPPSGQPRPLRPRPPAPVETQEGEAPIAASQESERIRDGSV